MNNSDRLRAYMNKSGISDREIADGIQLSATGRAKVEKFLDMTTDEADQALVDLRDFLQRKSELEESYKRLSEESFDDEIRTDKGSYNIQWKVGNVFGFGTAAFSGDKIKIVSVRDTNGNDIKKNEDKDFFSKIEQQAIDFIKEV